MADRMRQPQYIDRLGDFVRENYGISPGSIAPAKRGYYGETWRMDAAGGSYFLKLDYSARHQMKYQNSLPVVQYLCNSGIDYISRIVTTAHNELYTRFESAVLGVFEWIDGENIETDDTKIPEYKMLGGIYPLTKRGFNIPLHAFSDDTATRFYQKWDALKSKPAEVDNDAALAILERHSDMLSHCSARLSRFAAACRSDTSHYFLTHGDAGGNLLVNGDQYHIIDWDEVMYAPLERDAWVMNCHDWAVKAFADALAQNGIRYELRPERLAFYCYHMFFLYLGEFLDDFTLLGKRKEIEAYFDGWIMERLRYADKL